jgi:hypothetical protein
VHVSPHFPALCGVAQIIVNAGLPGFVGEHYWVTIRPAPIASWADDSTVQLEIESRDGARQFELADAAEGLQLWLQLAVLEGVAVLTRLTDTLHGNVLLSEDGPVAARTRETIRGKLTRLGRLPAKQQEYEVDDFFRAAALELLEEVDSEQFDYQERVASLAELLERGLDVKTLFGGYVYFIDEPERHLHPGIAREAAAWLSREMIKRAAQCVLTTELGGGVSPRDSCRRPVLTRRGTRRSPARAGSGSVRRGRRSVRS